MTSDHSDGGSTDRDVEAVLSFWFGEADRDKWFEKDADFDALVRDRLHGHYERACNGGCEAWRDSPRGCLALVILLDQVPRNLFRDDPRAFATDAAARAVMRHALARGFDRSLPQIERSFLYMPLEHSEDLADQEDCVRLMAALDENPEWTVYAAQHRDIIARFGRFPHRNRVLGRESSDAEIAFLKEPGSSF